MVIDNMEPKLKNIISVVRDEVKQLSDWQFLIQLKKSKNGFQIKDVNIPYKDPILSELTLRSPPI